ncbi:MAG: hypothetical protein BAJALOKI1v1_370008 [Promethearchaeota archaeon]|nr:MAG: hypothetical protein BAJALOKI1v1_370008 [Candidatus Lokiarchaeota archaeon]
MPSKATPKITIIIPTYNEELYIKDTLTGVLNQQCNFSYEIIVVDGNSGDNTVSIVEKRIEKIPHAYIYIAPERGKVPQLNHAASKAKSDLLLFLDADTVLIDPYFLKKIHKKFARDKDLYACSARFKYYDGHALDFRLGSLKFIVTPYLIINIASHIYYFLKSLFGFAELTGMNLLVRRSIFFEAGGFKDPPNSLGIDKVFSDSIHYLIKKHHKGKVKTFTFLSVLTSGRHLTIDRSLKRVQQYRSQKDIYDNLAKKVG